MNVKRWVQFFLFCAAVLSSVIAYGHLPLRVASHWNAAGVVNGTMDRFWGVALVPLLMLAFMALFEILPRLDPMPDHRKEVQDNLGCFAVILMAFFAYVHWLTLAWNLGYRFDMSRMIVIAASLLFFAIGTILPGMKRNWFVGIRTPWTYSDERVWDMTHRVGGVAYQIIGTISFLTCLFAPAFAFYVFLTGVFLATGYVIVYSYWTYRTLHKK